jgi:hypothetical protein
MPSSGILHRVALVATDVLEERIASTIRVTRIGELGTTLPVANYRIVVFTTATRLNFSEDGILHCHSRQNIKSDISLIRLGSVAEI